METRERIEALREWLRDPHYAIGPHSSTALHRQQLEDIWEEALHLARGDIEEALHVATEATKSGPQAGEAGREDRDRDAQGYERYQARLAGIPSKAFGAGSPFTGVDKVQHFFRSAELALRLESPGTAYMLGAAYEGLDWIRDVFGPKHTGGFDQGDLWADNLGAVFGIALTFDRYRSMTLFLQSAIPEDEIMVMPVGAAYAGGYIAEIIVPSPERQAAGEPIEVRCIDDDGYPYVMKVRASGAGDQVTYQRRGTSGYQLGRNDPWFRRDPRIEPAAFVPHRSDDPDEQHVRNPRFPVADEIRRQQELAQRLEWERGNFERQLEFAREQRESAQQASRMNYYNQLIADTEARLRDHDTRLQTIQDNLERMQAWHHQDVASRRPGEITPNAIHADDLAAQSRAQQIIRHQEEERERQQREAEQRRRDEAERQRRELQEQHRRDAERLHEQHRQQREQHHRQEWHPEPRPHDPPVNVS